MRLEESSRNGSAGALALALAQVSVLAPYVHMAWHGDRFELLDIDANHINRVLVLPR